MEETLILATGNGVVICERGGDEWREIRRGVENHPATCVIAPAGMLLAGTEDGVYRSQDRGKTWQESSAGLSVRHLRWMASHPDRPDFLLAGTEPADVFFSEDRGQNWQECPEVVQMRERYGWYLPYSPEAGAVRGFALNGSRAYAAVEDGCVLASDSGGRTWYLVEGSRGSPSHHPAPPYLHSDVHSIAVHPSSPARVYAPTGGGFYSSTDGGKTWLLAYPETYCRAVWIDPKDPQHMILGPADGVDRNGRIEETRDGAQTWNPASQGLSVPWGQHMVERFLQAERELYAVLSNGSLLVSPLARPLAWRRILPEVEGVRAAAWMG